MTSQNSKFRALKKINKFVIFWPVTYSLLKMSNVGLLSSFLSEVKMTSREDCVRAVFLSEQGRSQSQVAHELGLSKSAVQRLLKRYRETHSFDRRPGSGKKRCTTPRDDRSIVLNCLQDRTLNAKQLNQELERTRGVNVSSDTVRRRLKEVGIQPKRAATGPKLSREHKEKRLRFAREHADWTPEQWGSVLFTDESRVCLFGNDRRKRVYRRPGERYAQCCISEVVSFGGGSCMVWGGISLEIKSELVFIACGPEGGLNGQRYIDNILQAHVVPLAEEIGDQFVLMHDNARPHVANRVREFLAEANIPTLDWPALSPDLNPIEHLWDQLKRRVRERKPAPQTVPELRIALTEEWERLPQENIVNLIRSLPNRMNAVIRARGGNTKY